MHRRAVLHDHRKEQRAHLIFLLTLAGLAWALGCVPETGSDRGQGPLRPVASFTASPTSGPAPLQVQFTDRSSSGVTSWAWDFDSDGVVDSSEKDPLYTYGGPSPRVLSVTLTVRGPGGADTYKRRAYIKVTAPSSTTPTLTLTPTPASASLPTPGRPLTPTPTPTFTPTPSPSPTPTPTPSPTPMPVRTPTPTPSPSPTPTPSPAPTPTPIATATPTPTPTPTETPIPLSGVQDQAFSFQTGVAVLYPTGSSTPMGQEFRPTLRNVTRVDVFVAASPIGGFLGVRVREGSINGTILAQHVLNVAAGERLTWVNFDIPNIAVTREALYVIELFGSSGFQWYAASGDLYTRGTAIVKGVSVPNDDFWFRTWGIR